MSAPGSVSVPGPVCRTGGPGHNSGDESWGLSTPLASTPRLSCSGLGPCLPLLGLGSLLRLAPTLLPTSSVLPSTRSWRQRHPFNLLPRRQHGYAGRLSQHHGGRWGGGPLSLVFFCPYFLGIWVCVWGRGGPKQPCLPGSEVTSAQLEASNSHTKDRTLRSWSWWVFVLGAII